MLVEKTIYITIDILTQRLKVALLPCELRQSIVCFVRLGIESHVTAVAIKMPDERRVGTEGFWSGERSCVVSAPDSALAPESGQSRRSRQTGA